MILLPIIGFIVGILQSLLRPFQDAIPPQPGGAPVPFDPPIGDPTQQSDLGALVVTLITIVVIVAGLILLAALARRRHPRLAPGVDAGRGAPFVPPSFSVQLPRWRRPVRAGTPATATGAYVELDPLTLVERAETARLNRAVVHEHVSSATVDLDETEALLGVEPLHSSLCHYFS